MYKMMTGKSRCDVSQFFKLMPTRDGASNTRGSSGFLNVEEPLLSNTDFRRHFFSWRRLRVWNSLPDEVKRVSTMDGFKDADDA